MHRNYFLISSLFVALLLLWPAALRAEPQIYSHEGRAIAGYDPVAYFTEKKPVLGSAAFTYTWRKAKWFFSSADNRDRFSGNPEKYAPQYGGYCAYAMAYNANASIHPQAWSIVENRLYLNYSTYVKSQWQAKQASYISTADKNWKTKSLD